MMTMYMLLSIVFPFGSILFLLTVQYFALRPTILLIRYLSGILGDLQKLTQKQKVRVQTLHVHVATVQTEINCTLYYKHNI